MIVAASYAPAAPIHDVAGKGNLAQVKSLVKANPKILNLADKDGATPLNYAVAENRVAVVKFLLASKANVNAKKKNGRTPLHIAASLGLQDVVTLLLSKGADMNAQDAQGRTPLSIAKDKRQQDVISAFMSKTPKTRTGETLAGLRIGDNQAAVEKLYGRGKHELSSGNTYIEYRNPNKKAGLIIIFKKR